MSAFAEWLGTVFGWWGDIYSSSSGIETVVVFLHLGGMAAAAGMAFTLDRAVFRSARSGWPTRSELAKELHHAHSAILLGMAVVVVSGVALTLSDPTVFLESWIYWAKMAAVVLLFVNGWYLKRAGEELLAAPEDDAVFRRLKASALRSGGLWALVVLGGVAIINYA